MSTNNRHPWQSQKGDSIALIVSQLRELNTTEQPAYPGLLYFDATLFRALLEYDGYVYPEQTMDVFFDIYMDVLSKYPPPNKGYHNQWHIQKMLSIFDNSFYLWQLAYGIEWDTGFGIRPCRVKELGMLAILFHDIAYQQGAKDHEKRSAQFVEDYFTDKDYPAGKTRLSSDERKIVSDLILFTEVDNSKQKSSPLKHFIRDLDWMGFRDYDTMIANERLLQQEQTPSRKKPDKKKALIFYRSLRGVRLFNTPLFNSWNVPAQFNLKRRIYELEA